jgi:AraC-like DNA-binding protein
MSRTRFAKHFKECSGWTAMRYLTWWRMQLAYEKLNSGQSVAQVAEHIGYNSEAAFSRAFSKEFKLTAGQVKKQTTKN